MDPAQLEMLNAVTKISNITRTAARVHHMSSNLITRIHQLEADLGADLFIRGNQRLRLSPSRHNFLCCSQRILVLTEKARTVVAGDEPQGLPSLGSLKSTATVRTPATLVEYNQRRLKIQFVLATDPSSTMLDDVFNGILNTAFIGGPITHPGLEEMPVCREEIIIVTPNGHPPIKRASDVNGCNIHTFRTNCSYRHHFESWLHADRAMPSITHKMESYHNVLIYVIAGVGIALIPRPMLGSMPGYHQVNAWPLSESWRWLNMQLVWRRDIMTRQLEASIGVLDPQLLQSPE